jgi:hypothetical protein
VTVMVSERPSLVSSAPSIAREWSLARNGTLRPADVLASSHRRVWWKCRRGHQWQAVVRNRVRGSRCPTCDSLQYTHPQIAKQWHPSGNGTLTPRDVTYGSGKRLWWRCRKGHKWQATVLNRSRGSNCPFCSGKKADRENCLSTLMPTLAQEWHPKRNLPLLVEKVTPGSNRKVWWKCRKGHEWQSTIVNRSQGRGCPFCSNKAVNEENSLATLRPDLAVEWHPSKNLESTPNDVTVGSERKVWWKCGKGHEWKTAVLHRSRGSGCPYCSGLRVRADTCLAVTNPVIAGEWHPARNGGLTPFGLARHSRKLVWWKCRKGHEWRDSPAGRAHHVGCPYCHQKTSIPELRLLTELQALFDGVVHRKRIYGHECDIYIPSIGVAIEVDGYYWHKGSVLRDRRKNVALRKNGISVIRMRDKGLHKLSPLDVVHRLDDSSAKLVESAIGAIIASKRTDKQTVDRLRLYVTRGKLRNNEGFLQLLDRLSFALPGESLHDLMPGLASEWHPTKNLQLMPRDVTPGSGTKVWWKCSEGHEWKAAVNHRTNGTGCPVCAGRVVSEGNCLATLNPVLSREWHKTKNRSLTPYDVTPGSGKRVWWECAKGHEWIAYVDNRSNGSGCPYCTGRAADEKNCLATLKPGLAIQWHPTKNKPLTSRDVTTGSNTKVWWQCGRGHDWKAPVVNRVRGRGCPYCSGRFASWDNNLAILNPQLAKEWNTRKNKPLTPKGVVPGSAKKVWWICRKGHEWEAMIRDRGRGDGCPFCSGRRVKREMSV